MAAVGMSDVVAALDDVSLGASLRVHVHMAASHLFGGAVASQTP
jgi:hypothetical protein